MIRSRSGSWAGAVASAIGGAGSLLLPDQLVDLLLAQQAGQDGVADPRVVAGRSRAGARCPAIIRHWISASPVMLAGIVTAAVTSAADVGDEALGAGVPDVVLDHLVHGAVDVAALLAAAARRPRAPPAAAGRRRGSPGAAPPGRTRSSGPGDHARDAGGQLLADAADGAHGARSYEGRWLGRAAGHYGRRRARRAPALRLELRRPRGVRPATTTSWPSAPTSSRARCWRRTGAGLFPMPSGTPGDPTYWFCPVRRGVLPLDGAGRVALAAPLVPGLRDPRRHRLRGGRSTAARTRAGRPGGSTTTSARRTCGCTSWAGRTRSRPGATAGWPGGCTASPSAGSSRASRCSTGSATPRRWRWSGWWSCCATSGPQDRLIDVQWGTPHLASLGVVEVSRAAYLRRLPGSWRVAAAAGCSA